MEAKQTAEGAVTLNLTQAEAVVLHEVLASSEWSDELDAIELKAPVERKVISDVQQSLAPLIPNLGTPEYGQTVTRAHAQVDPGSFA